MTNEELIEEVKRYYSDNFDYISSDQPTLSILTNIAGHFAKWGYLRSAEKYNEIEYNRQRAEEDTPNDLEEAAKEYCPDDAYPFGPAIINRDIRLAFIAGAKWHKEQMMKEAVEGEIVKDISNKLAVTAKNVNLDGFKFGEKVKIIIVKE